MNEAPPSSTLRIGPRRRAEALGELADTEFDLLVVGGGITGAGVALDGASRGLRTALIERGDFSAGTSSRSSKLVHGGLRYLAQREIRLVYEALAERQRLLRLAPHLVQPLPHLIPVLGADRGATAIRLRSRAISSALRMYDLTGGARIGKFHRRIDASGVLDLAPALAPEHVAGGFLYYDARTDDARLTLEVARTAVSRYGAVAANYVELLAVVHEAGRAVGAELRDNMTGAELRVRARVVVNATGVWADDVRAFDEGAHPRSTRPAKGAHITLPRALVPVEVSVVLPVAGDKRSIFVVPWDDHVYVGTTDTDYSGPLDDPRCDDADVAYLLGALNARTREHVEPDAVTGRWAGLRPLVAGAADARTADLSRRHQVSVSSTGMVTITGGKLTTYRRMAADAVDAALGVLGHSARARRWRSHTKKVPIGGADRASALAALVEADPSLGETLVEGLAYRRCDAVLAARDEMAMTLEDVLSRRTRALLLERDASLRAAPSVAALLAPDLGWSPEEQARQVAAIERAW